jgi:hypothetical protein
MAISSEPSRGRRNFVQFSLLNAAWSTTSWAQMMPDRFKAYTEETINGQVPAFSRGIFPAVQPQTSKNVTVELTVHSDAPRIPLDKSLAIIAGRAWRFFQVSQSPSTGLFDSVLGYHYGTMWDIASGIAGSVCAEKLGLIDRAAFIITLQRILASLSVMPLYENELPNREYNIATLTMQGSDSRSSARGTGWSSTDMGRLLIWLKIASNWYPELQRPIRDLVDRWALQNIVKGGEAYGGYIYLDRAAVRQEGRLGYEQYAATGLALWGLDPHKALQCDSTEKFELLGVPLLRDTRNLACLTSEPFVMARMEIGHLNAKFDKLEHGIFEVQKKYSGVHGTLIATSEDSVDRQPWFLYNSVCFERMPWACVSSAGKPYQHLANLSAKTAIAWWAMYDDDYALRVFDAVKGAFDPQRGFYAGMFNTGGQNRSLGSSSISL